MEDFKLRIKGLDQDLTKKDLLEALEKIYYGKDSWIILPAAYDIVVAFIEYLRKDLEKGE